MAKNYITNPGETIAEAIAALGISTDELCKEFDEVLTAMEKKLDGYLGYYQGKQVYAMTMAEYLERKWLYNRTFVVIMDECFKVKGACPVVKGTTGTICAWRTEEGNIMPLDNTNLLLLLLAQNQNNLSQQQSIYSVQSQQLEQFRNAMGQVGINGISALAQAQSVSTQPTLARPVSVRSILKKEEEILSKEDMKYWLYF